MSDSSRRGRPLQDSAPLFPVPFCANPNCLYFHHPPPKSVQWCVAHGEYQTKAFGSVPRARCKRCGKTFSSQTYRLSYYMKMHVDLSRLYLELIGGQSLRAISRSQACSVGSVTNRIDRLCRQAIAMQQRLLRGLQVTEPLVLDGFVDYTVSQYFPDVLTMISGKGSQFIYGMAHCVVPRRGRMTDAQKRMRAILARRYQAPPRGEREGAAQVLVDTLSAVEADCVEVYSDEHQEYPPAVEIARQALAFMGKHIVIRHHRINSKQAHAVASPLFSANYLDRQLRLSLAAHRRETICFGRNVAANLARAVLYMVWHNYNKPYRIVDLAVKPPPHGTEAGVDLQRTGKWWDLFFERRVLFMKSNPEGFLRQIWLKQTETPLKENIDCLPKYAYA